jgi:hypothetical protein
MGYKHVVVIVSAVYASLGCWLDTWSWVWRCPGEDVGNICCERACAILDISNQKSPESKLKSEMCNEEVKSEQSVKQSLSLTYVE